MSLTTQLWDLLSSLYRILRMEGGSREQWGCRGTRNNLSCSCVSDCPCQCTYILFLWDGCSCDCKCVSSLFVFVNMIRSLTYSHADCELYINARNSSVLYIMFLSLFLWILLRLIRIIQPSGYFLVLTLPSDSFIVILLPSGSFLICYSLQAQLLDSYSPQVQLFNSYCLQAHL